MKNTNNIYDFLRSNGLKQIEQDTSKYFGDYYDTFGNNVFELRFSTSKSVETVDIRSVSEESNWYDLALVKALLDDKENLTDVTSTNEYLAFLKKKLNHISDLFSGKNYQATKMRLDELGNKRAKQMFPGV